MSLPVVCNRGTFNDVCYMMQIVNSRLKLIHGPSLLEGYVSATRKSILFIDSTTDHARYAPHKADSA